MDNRNKPSAEEQSGIEQTSQGHVRNPFESNQPVEKDIEQSQEDLEKEQQFKEALTERD